MEILSHLAAFIAGGIVVSIGILIVVRRRDRIDVESIKAGGTE